MLHSPTRKIGLLYHFLVRGSSENVLYRLYYTDVGGVKAGLYFGFVGTEILFGE